MWKSKHRSSRTCLIHPDTPYWPHACSDLPDSLGFDMVMLLKKFGSPLIRREKVYTYTILYLKLKTTSCILPVCRSEMFWDVNQTLRSPCGPGVFAQDSLLWPVASALRRAGGPFTFLGRPDWAGGMLAKLAKRNLWAQIHTYVYNIFIYFNAIVYIAII